MSLDVLLDAKVFALAARTGNRSGIYRYAAALVDHLEADNSCRLHPICSDIVDYPWIIQELKHRNNLRNKPVGLWKDHLGDISEFKASKVRNALRGESGHNNRRWLKGLLRELRRREPISQQYVRSQASRLQASVLHCPFHIAPLITSRPGHLTVVKTVHDLLPLSMPEFFTQDSVRRFRDSISSIDDNSHIICVSQAVRNDIQNHFPRINNARIHVTPLAGNNSCLYDGDEEDWHYFLDAYNLKEDDVFMLGVGTLEPRKNHLGLIEGFEKAVQSNLDSNLYLLLVGGLGWDYQLILDRILNSSLSHRIRWLGSIPDKLLSSLYQKALATVSVSWGEGFGLPVLESMQNKTPVIASTIPSHIEICSDAAYFVDPHSSDDLARAINNIASSSAIRVDLARRGKDRAAEFSWNKTAEATASIYKCIASL